MASNSINKQSIIEKFARKNNDSGSSEVQIALLTQRIQNLTEHLKVNKKDHSSRLGMLKLVGRRRRLLKYLKNKNHEVYSKLIKTLSLKDR